jgi:hypothetical protein
VQSWNSIGDLFSFYLVFVFTKMSIIIIWRTLRYVSRFVVNRIGRVMVSLLALRAVDRGFEPRSGQTKDY